MDGIWQGQDVAQQGHGTAQQERGFTHSDREHSQHPNTTFTNSPPHTPPRKPLGMRSFYPESGLWFRFCSPVWAGMVFLSMTLQRSQFGLKVG